MKGLTKEKVYEMFRLISTIRGIFTHDHTGTGFGIPWLALLLAGALALAGCEGDTGAAGPPGQDGQDGQDGTTALTDVTDATEVNAAITGVTIASPPVVEFRLTDARGNGLTGLEPARIRFTLAKLEDGVDGNASAWQSYINRVRDGAVQAYREPATDGTLVDNGDGSYTYTYATDVTNVTDPIVVTYDPSLTHRVGAEVRGLDVEVINPTYTFRPSDSATMGIFSRAMINDDSCNSCHNAQAYHGGARNTTEY